MYPALTIMVILETKWNTLVNILSQIFVLFELVYGCVRGQRAAPPCAPLLVRRGVRDAGISVGRWDQRAVKFKELPRRGRLTRITLLRDFDDRS